ncbi:hypothetical protein VPH35_020081 [Triticum aestivum]
MRRSRRRSIRCCELGFEQPPLRPPRRRRADAPVTPLLLPFPPLLLASCPLLLHPIIFRPSQFDPSLLSGGCRRRGAIPLLSPQGVAIPRRANLVLLEVSVVVDLTGSTVAARAPHPQGEVEEAPIAGNCRGPNNTDGGWEVEVRDSGDDEQAADASRRP